MKFPQMRATVALTTLVLLSACGGGGGAGGASTGGGPKDPVSGADVPGKDTLAGSASQDPASRTSARLASRFLAQASFGPTSASIAHVVSAGAQGWINDQFTKPQVLHRTYVDQVQSTLAAGTLVGQNQVFETFWKQAASGEDQLRQRVAFALSQIYVVSMVDGAVSGYPRGVASYYDMLGQHAFGNFRDLLEGVALHPMMGLYMSHMRNQKESGTRVPDENFAREVMQLMTIGLYELNPDGSVKVSAGTPVETYGHTDVAGMAKVFTGWSWAGPDKSNSRFSGGTPDPDRDWKPMQAYPSFHSTASKQFLGVSTGSGASAEADMKQALDALFNHPNVGPFIGRQLIQRLVMSNPSPGYVARVAAAFANNGAGVRGDMKSVISAILLDSEARAMEAHPKLREPVLRLANWMRAFNATSASGRYLMGNMDDPLNSIGQTPMRAQSVFNFFRPAYAPPNTSIAADSMVAPEMQIVAEPSVTGYLNFMQDAIPAGTGSARDIKANYSAELALADQPDMLIDRVDLLLLNGAMSDSLRAQLVAAVKSIVLPVANASNGASVAGAKNNRVYAAIFLAMASSEYLIQK